MDLDELRTVQRTERQKDTLQHLRDSFYRDVADYVAGLKERRDAAAKAADSPFSDPDVRRLSDEIETAEEVVESLYERRVGKVVKSATFAAADMGGDEGGLTDEERELYDDLVTRIRQNREAVLDTLAGTGAGDDTSAAEDATAAAEAPDAVGTTDGEATAAGETAGRDVPPDAPDPEPADAADDVLADAMGGGNEQSPTTDGGAGTARSTSERAGRADGPSPDSDGSSPDDRSPSVESPSSDAPGDAERTTVRITRDVGEILGVDERAYSLEREDVVTLPADNAEPLLRKDAAERLD
jgi:DNA replication factor GINS